ncbi:MAG: TIGR02206 family membrane protein [Cytophagales bacterium]|nr:MAG: TIGR02206 family membrane protein [Rhodothermaeota bacterium MED-G18]
MDVNYAIPFMSKDWIVANTLSLIYFISIMGIGKILSKKNRIIFIKYFVYLFITSYIIYHYLHVVGGTWSIDKRLPFHLCGFSSVITCFILFIKKKQLWFDFLFYAGILGGLNALLTPLIDNYTGTNFFYVEYFYSHTSIIILPLYMYYYMDMDLSKLSWLKSFIALNILLVFLMPLDFYIDANYMYLKEPPAVNHPLVSGKWPYYLINLEFVVVILLYFTYSLFKSPLFTNKKMV